MTDLTDLTDPDVRAAVADRLGAELWGGRPVVLGPYVLAGATPYVGWLRGLGCPVLVVATTGGAGEVPADDTCEVRWLTPPATATMTDELRLHDHLAHHLPAELRAAVDAFDPDRRGAWWATPFVTSDEPIDGRPVTGGRPGAFVALEDKMRADALWEAAGVTGPAHELVDLADDAALRAAAEDLAGPLGTVWSGDARDGFNGGGNYVRWVRDDADRAEALAWFRPRCDRVRIAPFLDGVPCSIHGFVLPDGTAALRPVEIAVLRDPGTRTFRYCGLGTTWDPPDADRAEMRAAVHRVGAHLQRVHGYRGAFGIDGVLTADGFRPTELNSRMSAGASTVAELDRRFFAFLQAALLAGHDTGLTVDDVEALVPAMDAQRSGKVVCVGEGGVGTAAQSHPLAWDGTDFSRSEVDTGNAFSIGATPSGSYARVEPCAALRPGERLAPVTAALLRYVERTCGAGTAVAGAFEPAPDVRVPA
ncbi:hypothetical protein G5V58_07070 [Nocardioides anomalus]|uniref:ATP-grasp domain-containing protein n=1 Tax=Nocardioides anomalus TaxID=2712223 RepID=A0A6G6WB50_9ACTN|nr:hypothetical protein [Nocardioides anomalus]QIG42571.1 hypothetical protein G5V58_07070 [Nocardioides anomalus]